MRIPGRVIDERFLDHGLRSTSAACIIAGVPSPVLFEDHLIVGHVVRWELLWTGLTFSAVRLA